MFKPATQAGQGRGEEALGLGAVEGCIGRAGRALIILDGRGLDFWIELRPAGGDECTALVAGEACAAGDVLKAGLVGGYEYPNVARGDGGGGGRTEFIRKKSGRTALLPGAAEFLVEAAVAGRGSAAIQRGADDSVFGIGEDDLLGGELGLGIDTERIWRGGFVVVALAAIEDEGRRKENERDGGRKSGKERGDFAIQF